MTDIPKWYRISHHLLFALSLLLLFDPPISALVKVATWNLLAPQYASPHKYPWCSTEYLDWTHRQSLILSRLENVNADIICLQEVQLDIWPELLEQLESYDTAIQNVSDGHNIACAILVRKESPYAIERIESRSRVLLAILRHENNAKKHIYLGSVHLEAGIKDGNDMQRYHQLKSLFKRLRHHCSLDSVQLEEAPIILAGDFNMLRSNLMYTCLLEGNLQHPEKAKSKAPISIVKFCDSIPLPMTFAKGYALDYIFTSDVINVEAPLPPLPCAATCIPQLWPSQEHPSDHLPIGVVLRI